MSEVGGTRSTGQATNQHGGQFYVQNATSPEPYHRPSIDSTGTGGMSSMYTQGRSMSPATGLHQRSTSDISGGMAGVGYGGGNAPMGMVQEEDRYGPFHDGQRVDVVENRDPFSGGGAQVRPDQVLVHQDGGRIDYTP